MRVNRARNTVCNFQVHLWDRVLLVYTCFRDITDGGGLDHVGNLEALDGLVFANTATAVCAAHERGVAPSLLVTAAITPLLRHIVPLYSFAVNLRM